MVVFFSLLAFFFAFFAFSTFSTHIAIYTMILAFLFSGIVYYLLTATYLAMMLFVVYVGAVAMLFVFCVMLLNLSAYAPNTFAAQAYAFFFFYFFIFSFLIFTVYATDAVFTLDFFSISSASLVTPEYSWTSYSKDELLTYVMFHNFLPVLTLLGFVLFVVTILVTVLFGLFEFEKPN